MVSVKACGQYEDVFEKLAMKTRRSSIIGGFVETSERKLNYRSLGRLFVGIILPPLQSS